MNWTRIFTSRGFKISTMVLGLLFMIASIFISVDPQVFLKLGYLGVFGFNLFSSGIFIIPSLVGQMNVWGLAIASGLGMTINDSISWYVGSIGADILPYGKKGEKIVEIVRKYGIFAIFFFALIPFPYDGIGIIAGYLKINFWLFILTILIARIIRFLLLGYGVLGLKSF